MGISFEPKGWSDAEVDEIIQYSQDILTEVQVHSEHLAYSNLLLLVAGFFVVAIFAFIASGMFFPTASEITGD